MCIGQNLSSLPSVWTDTLRLITLLNQCTQNMSLRLTDTVVSPSMSSTYEADMNRCKLYKTVVMVYFIRIGLLELQGTQSKRELQMKKILAQSGFEPKTLGLGRHRLFLYTTRSVTNELLKAIVWPSLFILYLHHMIDVAECFVVYCCHISLCCLKNIDVCRL